MNHIKRIVFPFIARGQEEKEGEGYIRKLWTECMLSLFSGVPLETMKWHSTVHLFCHSMSDMGGKMRDCKVLDFFQPTTITFYALKYRALSWLWKSPWGAGEDGAHVEGLYLASSASLGVSLGGSSESQTLSGRPQYLNVALQMLKQHVWLKDMYAHMTAAKNLRIRSQI